MTNPISQKRSPYDFNETDRIKRFVLENGFINTNAEVLDALSKLIYRSTVTPNLVMKREYALLASDGTDGGSYRAKLSYYAKLNLESVRTKFLQAFNYDIGKFFSGVKAFVERIAMVYSIYAGN